MFCPKTGAAGYKCLFEKCPFVAFTSRENVICYIGEDSSTTEIIAIGEENSEVTDRWKQICIRKINEAYEEFEKFQKTVRKINN